MDSTTEDLLDQVETWFKSHIQVMALGKPNFPIDYYNDQIDQIDSTIRTLCTDGDPDTAQHLVDRYLSPAYDVFTTNTSGGVQDVKPLLTGWTGEAAAQFQETYLPDMCNAVNNYLNIAQGMVVVMNSYVTVLNQVRASALSFLQAVRAAQDQCDRQSQAEQQKVFWSVVDCVVSTIAGIVAGPEVTIIDVLMTTAKDVTDVVSQNSSVGGTDPADLLRNTADRAEDLMSATRVEISKLEKMVGKLVDRNTPGLGFQVTVPAPEVVTDGGDPTKFTDRS